MKKWIISVNVGEALIILDLDEDIELEYMPPSRFGR